MQRHCDVISYVGKKINSISEKSLSYRNGKNDQKKF